MRARGILVVAVVVGGVALGGVLGAAANPVMRNLPDAGERATVGQVIVTGSAYQLVEAGPEDLSPYPDGYAPAYASGAIESWEPEYPAWTYSDFGEDAAEPAIAEAPVLEPEPLEPAEVATAPPPAQQRHADTLGPLY
jgi:hypothetical protein